MTQLPGKQSSRAVLFGCGKFESEDLADLPAVGRNLADLQALLTSPETGVFDKQHADVLRGEDCAGVRGAYQVLSRAGREATDTFLVYYAGHGLTSMRRNELYLCLADTDPDALSVSALSIDAIREVFLDCPARNRVLILDCCFSGRATHDYMASTSELMAGQSEITGTYTLASAPPTAASLAPPGERYTAFTGALIEMLRDGEQSGPELLTLDVLYGGLRRRMNARGLPLPTQRGTDLAHHLAMGRNPAYSLRAGVHDNPSASPWTDSRLSPPLAPPAGLGVAAAALPEVPSPSPRPHGRNWSAVSGLLLTLVYAALIAYVAVVRTGVVPTLMTVTGYVSGAIALIITFTALLGRLRQLLLPAVLGGCFTNIHIYQSGKWTGAGYWAGAPISVFLVEDAVTAGVIVLLFFGVRKISGRSRWAKPRILPALLFGGAVLSTAIGCTAQVLQATDTVHLPYSSSDPSLQIAESVVGLATASFAAWLALGWEQHLAGGAMLLGWAVEQVLGFLTWATEGWRFSGWIVAVNWITVLLMMATAGLAIIYTRHKEQQAALVMIRSGRPKARHRQ